MDSLTKRIDHALCGLIVAGPGAARSAAEAEAIHHLSRQLGWPLLADVVSGLRLRSTFPFYDVFLRGETLASLAPDVVLEFGGNPTSKVLNQYLDRHRAAWTTRFQPHEVCQDPSRRANETMIADTVNVCRALADRIEVARDSLLFEPFQRAAGMIRVEADRLFHEQRSLDEMSSVHIALGEFPGGNLALSSSMPVRYADMLLAGSGKRLTVYAQRGTNGIDGSISHAAGIAAGSDQPTLLIIGDLAFCHDMGGLMTARKHGDRLSILLLNNNGGGIFHHLPVAEFPDTFEQIHGTPHHLDLQRIAGLFNLGWIEVRTPEQLREAMQRKSSRLKIMEVRTDRVETHRNYQQLIQQLTGALH